MAVACKIVWILFTLIQIFHNCMCGYKGNCEEAIMIVEWQRKCPGYDDPLSCHAAYDDKQMAYMCEWSDENELVKAKDIQQKLLEQKKKVSKHELKLKFDELPKGDGFKEGETFWVWFPTPKPKTLVKKQKSKIAAFGAQMKKSFSKKKPPLPELDYNKYCEYLVYKDGKLTNAFYDTTFMDPEVAAHLKDEPWFSIEVETKNIALHTVGMGQILHARNVKVSSHKRGEKKKPKKKKVVVTKDIYIRKILDTDSNIWFVLPDGIEDTFSLHEVFYQNFDTWISDTTTDITLWNQEMVFNNIKVAHEKELPNFYGKPPKGIVWVGGKVGDAQDKTKGREKAIDMFGANKGKDKSGPFDLLKFIQPLQDKFIYRDNVYNDNWWFYALQMDKHFTTNKARNKDEWRGCYERRTVALLKETSSRKYGMGFFDNIFTQVFIPTQQMPIQYKWSYKGDVKGKFTDTILGTHHYTTKSDQVNLWVMGVSHGSDETTAQQLADALEKKTGVFGGIDVILLEHDFGRLYEQLREIKQNLKKFFDSAKSTTPDETARTQLTLDQMAVSPNWYKSDIVLYYKNEHQMEKTLPVISAMRTGIPIVLCDSPEKLAYPTLFAQPWDFSRYIKGSKSNSKRDNLSLNWLYRAMWMTQRNHAMVNGINEAVSQYYASFMAKTAVEQQAKAKKNYLIIIGYEHWTAQRADSSMWAIGYKLGMHPMLTNPELFADTAITGNMQCEFNALPYSKQFAKVMSGYTKKQSAHVGYVYNEYGYDGYDAWDLDNEEYDKYSVYKPETKLTNWNPFVALILLCISMMIVVICMVGCVGILLYGMVVLYKYSEGEKYDNTNADSSAV